MLARAVYNSQYQDIPGYKSPRMNDFIFKHSIMLPFPWRIDGYSETKDQLNNTKSLT